MSRTYAASRPSSTRVAVADGDVVDDPHAVAEPVGAAPLDRLPDRRQPERLAGVDREVGVLPLEVLERVEVAGGRVPRLGAGDVEAGDAAVAPGDRELGDLAGAGLVPHGGEQLADDDPAAPARPSPRRSRAGPRRRPRRASARRSRAARGRSAPRRTRRRRRPGPPRTRGRPGVSASASCITATVWSNVSRYRSSDPEFADSANQRPSDSASVAGSAWPISSASSTIVAGRSPPSRWSCSRALGARAIWSAVAGSPVADRACADPRRPAEVAPGAHLHQLRRRHRRRRRGPRRQRLADHRPGPRRPRSPRRPATTSGSTSTSSARRPGRSAAPSPTAT